MSSKIFKSIWIAAISVFLASLVFILGISYNYFTEIQKNQLKNETELAAAGVALSGKSYFDNLNPKDYRITWIDSSGNVLFDNEINAEKMENHLEREEIKEALTSGIGESSRYSDTLAEKQLYAAKRLPDGSVIRLAVVQLAIWALFLGFAQPICFVIVIALVLSFLLASRLARKIVEPINEIDLDNPSQYYDQENYKEVEPLLRRISAQQRQIKNDQEQIEQTALIRQEFTANVSHELKTPLHAISGYAELIEKGLVKDDDIKSFAEKTRIESVRLTNLVEDIINLTRLDNGVDDTEEEECDLYRIAENAIDSLEVAAFASNITVTLDGTCAPMLGIPQMLYSVVYNLCDNAIKYNYSGGSVKVTIDQEYGKTILSVKDSGVGIPDECIDRIFERFYRVDKSHSKEVGGTGLGLSIVKHAVIIHNGKIDVNSKVGEGTEFIIILPIRKKEL